MEFTCYSYVIRLKIIINQIKVMGIVCCLSFISC